MRNTHTDIGQNERCAIGAVVGAAVGDALGAPFEFLSPGLYLDTFPEPVHTGLCEMIGGGSFDWEPGEFTDDTQMGVALAEAILEQGAYDPDVTWRWFLSWSATATDIGTTTSWSLSHDDWRDVANHPRHSASNGALMRSFVLAVALNSHPDDVIRDVVLHQSSLTHPHPASGWGAWIAVELCRTYMNGEDALARLDDLLALIPASEVDKFAEMLHPSWTPLPRTLNNGSVWGCLAEAVWALRSTSSFEDAVVAAVNLGDDADTVGCVTGALAGARYGIEQVPQRWRDVVHGRLDAPDGPRLYTVRDLERIALDLLTLQPR
jgi:ADP-ribosyl-[dinitrogen reductase] hydrolase